MGVAARRTRGTEHSGGMVVRPYRPADEPAAYEVCLRTGDNGEDATGRYEDPALLGHVYVGPYLHFAPEHAYVLDAGGELGVVGYALGVPETVAFEQWCEAHWWPALRERYLDPAGVPREHRTPDQQLAEVIHYPERAPAKVAERYPAHLHIDLLPPAQGQGWGPRMLRTLFADLAAAGSPGVHLGVSGVNHRAIAVYRKLGFTELDRGPGGLLLARPLP